MAGRSLTFLAIGAAQETESDRSSHDDHRQSLGTPPSSPPGSPRPPNFAPRGLVKPRIGFRGKIPGGLTLNVDLTETVSKIKYLDLKKIHGAYSVRRMLEVVMLPILTCHLECGRLCCPCQTSPELHRTADLLDLWLHSTG